MNSEQVFPSKFLKGADLENGDLPLTIKFVAMETMRDQSGDEVEKPVLYFQEKIKGLVLNKTNWKAIAELYGDESENWSNKRVTLGTVRVDAFGKVTNAIRIVPTRAQKTEEQISAELTDVELPY